ncbi:hypothetical protein [Thalassotalea ganghwensis]
MKQKKQSNRYNGVSLKLWLMSCFIGINSYSSGIEAKSLTELTVEEQRLASVKKVMPQVLLPLKSRVTQFAEQVSIAKNYTALTQLIIRHGDGLWRDAVQYFSNDAQMDDRILYWSRLSMTMELRKSKTFSQLLPMQQEKLLWLFELLSRGQKDVKFRSSSKKKILITGFDPFFLDKDISQSNPSGVSALALDDLAISIDGVRAEIESIILPVRFADFDQGMVEEMLTTYIRDVDMIVTISMGRDSFDLERFPGLRRSAKAPDNINVFSGASKSSPLKPKLNNKVLLGPEFVEFSLPAEAMLTVQSPYKVNDNRVVETLAGKELVKELKDINRLESVEGSGGGYLSNEVSYRSILLREQFKPLLPVGHIHTPRITGFEPTTSEKIVQQIKQMLTKAAQFI